MKTSICLYMLAAAIYAIGQSSAQNHRVSPEQLLPGDIIDETVRGPDGRVWLLVTRPQRPPPRVPIPPEHRSGIMDLVATNTPIATVLVTNWGPVLLTPEGTSFQRAEINRVIAYYTDGHTSRVRLRQESTRVSEFWLRNGAVVEIAP